VLHCLPISGNRRQLLDGLRGDSERSRNVKRDDKGVVISTDCPLTSEDLIYFTPDIMMKEQLPDTLNEESMEGDEGFSTIIASINPLRLRELALTTRQNLYDDLYPETSCVVSTPPRMGSFNIVYELTFSDGIKWAIRLPATDNVFSPSRLRSFYLDVVTQRLIQDFHTSTPYSLLVP